MLRARMICTVALLVVSGTASSVQALVTCPNMTLAWVPAWTQVNGSSNPGVSKYGMEDGIVVRRDDGGFTMLAAEMYSRPYAVAMQLGVYTSSNALDWRRQRTIRRSAGTNDGSDQHAAHWGPLLTKNAATNTWLISYVAYKVRTCIHSGVGAQKVICMCVCS